MSFCYEYENFTGEEDCVMYIREVLVCDNCGKLWVLPNDLDTVEIISLPTTFGLNCRVQTCRTCKKSTISD